MRSLERKLKELQAQGYETVTIVQIQLWIHEIQMNRRAKRIEARKKNRT